MLCLDFSKFISLLELSTQYPCHDVFDFSDFPRWAKDKSGGNPSEIPLDKSSDVFVIIVSSWPRRKSNKSKNMVDGFFHPPRLV